MPKEKQEIMSLRIAEQLVKGRKPEIWNLRNTCKCLARKMLKKLLEKPQPAELSALFGDKKYLKIFIGEDMWYILLRTDRCGDYKMFALLEDVEEYLEKSEYSACDLDGIIDEQYKPIEKTLNRLYDSVLSAESKDRKAKYEKFISSLESEQARVELNAGNAYNSLVFDGVKPENNC